MQTLSDAEFDALRAEGDPPADAAMDAIVTLHLAPSLHGWLGAAERNGDPLPAELPQPVRALFDHAAEVAARAEERHGPALREARAFFAQNGVACLQGLLYRSLPELYASAPGAAALIRSRRITDDVERRLYETLQFVVDVLSPDAFGPEGRGVRSAVRVRLMHAAARRRLQREPGAAERFEGVAINQEDLAATLVAFSAFTLDSIRALGADTSPRESAAWMTTWRAVGKMIGVRPDQLPRTEQDAQARFAAFRRRHHRPSTDSRALTAALLRFADTLVPGRGFDGVNPAMLRHLSGDPLADLLEVPPAGGPGGFIAAWRALVNVVDDLGDDSKVVRRFTRRAGEWFVRGLLSHKLPDGRDTFSIPRALADEWGGADAAG